jgi:hypothetical protein
MKADGNQSPWASDGYENPLLERKKELTRIPTSKGDKFGGRGRCLGIYPSHRWGLEDARHRVEALRRWFTNLPTGTFSAFAGLR